MQEWVTFFMVRQIDSVFTTEVNRKVYVLLSLCLWFRFYCFNFLIFDWNCFYRCNVKEYSKTSNLICCYRFNDTQYSDWPFAIHCMISTKTKNQNQQLYIRSRVWSFAQYTQQTCINTHKTIRTQFTHC